ncbi:MAG: hypothetical protein IK006_07875 [Bacteroidaceae bacterium]|nr:hypothetical protein [Bacteroidaceae bacterium]
MKRTIRALLLIMTVSLFTVSCSETTRNTIAVSGKWQLTRTVLTENGEVVYDKYAVQEDRSIFYEFNSNNELVQTIITSKGTDIHLGRWLVDEDILVLSFAEDSQTFHIEKTSLLEMVLSESYTENGKNYVYTITLRSYSEKK